MGMTLNEHLAEVDKWKQAVGDEVMGFSDAERLEYDRRAVAWLEAQLGVQLDRAPAPRSATDGIASRT